MADEAAAEPEVDDAKPADEGEKKKGKKKKSAPKPGQAHVVLRILLVAAGALLIVGFFFFPWLKLDSGTVSGLQLVMERNPDIHAIVGDDTKLLHLWLIPGIGVALIGVGAAGMRYSGIVGAALGLVLVGYGIVTLVILFVQVTGLGLWLSLLGAFIAIISGLVAFARSRNTKAKPKEPKLLDDEKG